MKLMRIGACLLLITFLGWGTMRLFSGNFARSPLPKTAGTPEAWKTEIESLKKLLPDQAHAMTGVGYHFSNLWFAGQAGNWPLAEFYFKETRSNLQWAVRIKPVRQDSAKQNIEPGQDSRSA